MSEAFWGPAPTPPAPAAPVSQGDEERLPTFDEVVPAAPAEQRRTMLGRLRKGRANGAR